MHFTLIGFQENEHKWFPCTVIGHLLYQCMNPGACNVHPVPKLVKEIFPKF